jgi:phosphoglycolate phosphatase-like HAD superfamily hydrolase
MQTPIASVIFYVEGTLIDCLPRILESWQEILAAAGHGVDWSEIQRYSGMDGQDMLDRPATLRSTF